MFFLQYCILFPLWLFSQSSVAYVHKAEVLSLLVFDLLPQLLHIKKKKSFQMQVLFSLYRIYKVLIWQHFKINFNSLMAVYFTLAYREVAFSSIVLWKMTFC